MKPLFLIPILYSVFLLPSSAGAEQTFEVSSRKGWQQITFDTQMTRISGITGGWSVDDNNYSRVGPEGHQGRAGEMLAPHNARKFDTDYPFGALLISYDGKHYTNITGPMEFYSPV